MNSNRAVKQISSAVHKEKVERVTGEIQERQLSAVLIGIDDICNTTKVFDTRVFLKNIIQGMECIIKTKPGKKAAKRVQWTTSKVHNMAKENTIANLRQDIKHLKHLVQELKELHKPETVATNKEHQAIPIPEKA